MCLLQGNGHIAKKRKIPM
uniref:Uncharacterized protein n=1 Tax=Anguilla anguilla TaxID=7936 RepID=A0A0E9S4B9_ANGAN